MRVPKIFHLHFCNASMRPSCSQITWAPTATPASAKWAAKHIVEAPAAKSTHLRRCHSPELLWGVRFWLHFLALACPSKLVYIHLFLLEFYFILWKFPRTLIKICIDGRWQNRAEGPESSARWPLHAHIPFKYYFLMPINARVRIEVVSTTNLKKIVERRMVNYCIRSSR